MNCLKLVALVRLVPNGADSWSLGLEEVVIQQSAVVASPNHRVVPPVESSLVVGAWCLWHHLGASVLPLELHGRAGLMTSSNSFTAPKRQSPNGCE